MRVDAVFVNGRVWTGDRAMPEVREFAVLHGRFVAVGDVSGLRAARRVDLGGRRVVPGFHDAHHHLGLTGRRLLNVDVRPQAAASLSDLYELIRRRAAVTGVGEWIFASGYDQNFFGGVHPTAVGLDGVAPSHPVMVEHVSGHMVVANTAAFRAAGFSGRCGVPDFAGGRVVRDGSGRAAGLLVENAMHAVRGVAARAASDAATVADVLARASGHAVSYGLTSITEPGVSVDGALGAGGVELHHYLSAVEGGVLLPRVTVMPFHQALHPVVDSVAGFCSLDWGIRTGLGDDRLRIGPVKIISDGSLIGRSAAVHECFCGEPDNFGVLQLSAGELLEAFVSFHRAGWAVATHAIGDRAIDGVLDAVEVAQKVLPRGVRHRVEHFAMASDAQVARAARLGVVAVPQGVFISDFGDGIFDAIGGSRVAGCYRMRSLLDAGMVVPGSTDSPVSDANPLRCIHDLVNRRCGSGRGFALRERVSVAEAVSAYTYGSAYAVSRERDVGRIVDGQLADVTVLSEDIFRVPAEEIADIQVVATVIGGVNVYEV